MNTFSLNTFPMNDDYSVEEISYNDMMSIITNKRAGNLDSHAETLEIAEPTIVESSSKPTTKPTSKSTTRLTTKPISRADDQERFIERPVSRQDDLARRISENANQQLPDWLLNN